MEVEGNGQLRRRPRSFGQQVGYAEFRGSKHCLMKAKILKYVDQKARSIRGTARIVVVIVFSGISIPLVEVFGWDGLSHERTLVIMFAAGV